MDHVARVRAAREAAQREMESFGDVSEYDITIIHGRLKEAPAGRLRRPSNFPLKPPRPISGRRNNADRYSPGYPSEAPRPAPPLEPTPIERRRDSLIARRQDRHVLNLPRPGRRRDLPQARPIYRHLRDRRHWLGKDPGDHSTCHAPALRLQVAGSGAKAIGHWPRTRSASPAPYWLAVPKSVMPQSIAA